jgi:hypothetical protein
MSDPGSATPAKVRRHLMDPANPRPQNREPMSLGTVQKWVLSTLAATTIMHLAMGLVVAAAFADKPVARVGLLVIAAAFGVIAMVAALLIHRHRLVSTWLLLGLAPAAVGAFVIF